MTGAVSAVLAAGGAGGVADGVAGAVAGWFGAGWRYLVTAQDAPSPAAAGLALLAAAAIVAWRPSWLAVRNLVTILHEGGHALVATLCGRSLGGIRLHSDTSGVTVTRGAPRGPGMVFTAAAGYPAPALAGLGAAALVAGGHVNAVFAVLVVVLALVLALVRNWYGLWIVLVTGALVVLVVRFVPASLTGPVATALAGVLLFGPWRTLVELQGSRRRERGRVTGRSDADQLGVLTHLPAGVWLVMFWLVVVACTAVGLWSLAPWPVAEWAAVAG